MCIANNSSLPSSPHSPFLSLSHSFPSPSPLQWIMLPAPSKGFTDLILLLSCGESYPLSWWLRLTWADICMMWHLTVTTCLSLSLSRILQNCENIFLNNQDRALSQQSRAVLLTTNIKTILSGEKITILPTHHIQLSPTSDLQSQSMFLVEESISRNSLYSQGEDPCSFDNLQSVDTPERSQKMRLQSFEWCIKLHKNSIDFLNFQFTFINIGLADAGSLLPDKNTHTLLTITLDCKDESRLRSIQLIWIFLETWPKLITLKT